MHTTQIKNPNSTKLVCLENSQGRPMRVPRNIANHLMLQEPGLYHITNKSSMFHTFNKHVKVHNTEEATKNIDFSNKQNDNFITQEGDKIMGYIHMGFKNISYNIPEDAKEAEKKKTWIEGLIQKACINPDDTLKKNLLTKILTFFGFLEGLKDKLRIKKKNKFIDDMKSVDLPKYQRRIMGYGQLPPQSAN